MLLREVEYARPSSVEEALRLLAANDGARALAGGQTLIKASSQVEVTRPIVAEVVGTIADVQVRNRGTIGGNVCSNDPTNHLPVLMAAIGAQFTIASQSGERTVASSDFFLGVYLTAVGSGE